MTTATRRSRRRRQKRKALVLPALVAATMVAGVGVLLYPSASSWINQAQQSAIIAQYSDDVGQRPSSGLAESLAAARTYNASLTGGAVVAAGRNVPDASGPAASPSYRDLLDVNGRGLMARIRIPSIAADLPIYHGTSDSVLLQGVGHLEGTALPVGGVDTHAVLTAHRGLADAELFTHLDLVAAGDTFTIEVFGEVLVYRVTATRVVEPEDTETLFPVAGEDLVTLVTCTPLGVNTQRILVTGERITPTPIKDLDSLGARPDVPGFPWWALGGGGAVLLAGLYVAVAVRPRTPCPPETSSTPRPFTDPAPTPGAPNVLPYALSGGAEGAIWAGPQVARSRWGSKTSRVPRASRSPRCPTR